jgi:carbon-monoxide dehydrogenase large subunit
VDREPQRVADERPPRRDQIQYIDIAADREGNVKGLKVHILSDMGAYLRLVSPGVPVLGAFMYPGIYKFPAYRFDCQGVFTNKTPTDAYRGAGRPEATFAIERIMDELAVELDMDPLELRRKNWIRRRSSRSPRAPGSSTTAATTSTPPSRR